jgi:hypothetical protein
VARRIVSFQASIAPERMLNINDPVVMRTSYLSLNYRFIYMIHEMTCMESEGVVHSYLIAMFVHREILEGLCYVD